MLWLILKYLAAFCYVEWSLLMYIAKYFASRLEQKHYCTVTTRRTNSTGTKKFNSHVIKALPKDLSEGNWRLTIKYSLILWFYSKQPMILPFPRFLSTLNPVFWGCLLQMGGPEGVRKNEVCKMTLQPGKGMWMHCKPRTTSPSKTPSLATHEP